MEFILENWEVLLVALMAFAKVVINLLPSEHPAIPIFGYFDLIITAITGDRRKKAKDASSQEV
jgi:hypothetical protein